MEGGNSRKSIYTEKIYIQNFFLVQAGEDVGEHGLVKKAGVKPQDDSIAGSGLFQFLVLAAEGFEGAFFFQSTCCGLFQELGTGLKGILRCPSRISGAIVENIMPDKHLSR